MRDWNVVVCVYQEGFRRVLRLLREIGAAERSAYYNVLVMRAEDPVAALAAIEKRADENPALYDSISRVAPATRSFDYESSDEFVSNTGTILREWSSRLAGRTFHVRLHRRGAKDDLSTQETEHLFNDVIIDATATTRSPGKVCFIDPDATIAIDTIDQRAGLGFWTREDLAQHRLLRPD
jgi:tRNA(Ser,Leu) C12 N-acetylase TAN1